MSKLHPQPRSPMGRQPRRGKPLNSRGETLVETLAAILIAALSVALLVGSVTASGNLARQADQSDESFFSILTEAENRESPLSDGVSGSQTVTITEGGGKTATIPVQVYGGEDLYSYARQAATPEGGEGS